MLLGFETSDDAALVPINDEQTAVLTVDFFTPIVDDPYDFGRIAAANSLSDVYAMGAKPVAALNLLAFPCSLGADVIGAVMRGGNIKVREAGAFTLGGHTIEDKEPKFGLSVFGLVHPDKVITNKGAKPGDYLYLSKAIGTGIMTTALKFGHITDSDLTPVVDSMSELNKAASEAMVEVGAHAGTDVTGFGLIGHLHELCEPSEVSAEIDFGALKLFNGVYDFATQGIVPGKTKDMVQWAKGFSEINCDDTEKVDTIYKILCDPQTSGGILCSIAPDKASEFERIAQEKLGRPVQKIGMITEGRSGFISVKA